jgi:hypothetical protein
MPRNRGLRAKPGSEMTMLMMSGIFLQIECPKKLERFTKRRTLLMHRKRVSVIWDESKGCQENA